MAQVEEVLCILCQKYFLTKILIPSSTVYSSRARWPLAPTFCSQGNRKSQFSHRLIEIICRAHYISQFQGTGFLLISLRAQPCLFNNVKRDKEEKVHLATFCFFQTNLCNMVHVPDVPHYDYCMCQRICQDHRNNLCCQTHCLKEQRQENNHYYLQIQ